MTECNYHNYESEWKEMEGSQILVSKSIHFGGAQFHGQTKIFMKAQHLPKFS